MNQKKLFLKRLNKKKENTKLTKEIQLQNKIIKEKIKEKVRKEKEENKNNNQLYNQDEYLTPYINEDCYIKNPIKKFDEKNFQDWLTNNTKWDNLKKNKLNELKKEILTKKPIVPTEGEIKENSRASSSKLRIGIKL